MRGFLVPNKITLNIWLLIEPKAFFFLALVINALVSFSAWAVCSYSGTKNQEGSLKHDGASLYRCDSSNNWESLGSIADNLGDHTATQNLILGSYYLSGDGGNEGVSVDSTGKVGVGTISPLAPFHVFSNSGWAQYVGQDNSGYQLRISLNALGAYNNNSVSQLLLNPSGGNIGIGTSSPITKLNISASDGNGYGTILLSDGSGNGRLMLGAETGGSAYLASMNNVDLKFAAQNSSTLGTPAMTIKSSGNIGIGTTTPTTPLDISGLSNVASATYSGGTNMLRLLAGPGSAYSEQAIAFQEAGADAGAKIAVKNRANGAYDIIFANRDTSSLTSAMNERMRIDSSGNIGIGTTSPGYKLDVQGGDINASGSVRSAGIALTSDIRYKHDIEPIENALEKISKIRGVSYNWRIDEFPRMHFSERTQIGVLAQEVEAQFPEVVDENVDGYKSVNYPALVAPIIEAVKSLAMGLKAVESVQALLTAEIAAVRSKKDENDELKLLRVKNRKLELDNWVKANEIKNLKARLDRIEKFLSLGRDLESDPSLKNQKKTEP